jgi:hypothetical protein
MDSVHHSYIQQALASLIAWPQFRIDTLDPAILL